ncbi:MAG TPA: type 1 glutamine amidotransferase domain-containing protein, partial [Candidatus Aquicultoraceae bacterium]|nr:type 1 glutamine amidotransferase domain-containing protein [Candidatus Aquicultoraceae bacterium]
MDLSGKRIAVLAEDLYEDLELWYPVLRFREAGADVIIVGAGETSYSSKHGYPARPDRNADEVTAADFDAVVVPGGYAPDRMRRHKAMVELVRDADRQGKVVAAICHGGWMLASADVLRGKKATGFFAIRDDLVNAGAVFEDR